MQASAMKACFRIAECSLSYAKIVQISETTKCLGNFFPRFLKLYILNRWDDAERWGFRMLNSNEYLQTQRGKL